MNGINYYSPEQIERAFFNASNEQNTSFIRFILLWASFNSRIARDSRELTDRKMITWVKGNESVYPTRYQELLDTNQNFTALVNKLSRIRVINFMEFKYREKARRENRTRQDKSDFKQVQNGDFSSLIEVIYLVRCNIVHGSKNIERQNESNLVDLCFQILMELYRPDII